MENKLYRVYDNVGGKLVGYFDTSKNILLGMYHYLKHIKEEEGEPDEWIEYIGDIDDFKIYEIKINEFLENDEEDKRVHIIDSPDYKHFMLYGPRELNIDIILND